MIESEKLLINKLLLGDAKSLNSYYRSYKERLLRYINNKIANPQDGEEILQDVFLGSLDALRNFTFKSSLYTYLCSIANHKVIDFYRKQKIKNIVFSRLPGNISPLVSQLLTPEEELSSKEVKEQIKEVMRRIKPVYSTLIRLKYVEGYSLKQIAKKLVISCKSAESMLFRARTSFVKQYILLYREY